MKQKCAECNGSRISYYDKRGNRDHMNAHVCACNGQFLIQKRSKCRNFGHKLANKSY
jgi:hypothetical protein